MATTRRIALQYDPEQLRSMVDHLDGDTSAFGARLAGLMMGGPAGLEAIPLAMYGVVHLSTEDVAADPAPEACPA